MVRGRAITWPRSQQRAGGGGDVGLAHEAFADEEGVHAGLGQPLQVGVAGDAAFGDDDAVLRHARGEPLGRLQRGGEGLEVAVVDADQPAVERQRAVELLLVVHLGDGVHAPRVGVGAQRAGHHVVDGGHDDQDAVGAQRARLRHLVAVEHEVLAQRGQLGGGARLRQMLGRALEGGAVGEHGQARRAARRVGLGERGRIEVGADQALGGARLLDLGDERGLAGGDLGLQRRGEAAHGRGLVRVLLHGRERPLGDRVGDLFQLVGGDLLENVCHGGLYDANGGVATRYRVGGQHPGGAVVPGPPRYWRARPPRPNPTAHTTVPERPRRDSGDANVRVVTAGAARLP